MDILSFDALRSLQLPGVTYLKPAAMAAHRERILAADGVIFPEYWQINPLVHALGVRIFPGVASYRIGHDKIEMTRCFELVAPRNVPLTLILANTPANADSAWDAMPLPFVAKLPRSSMGLGVFLIETRAQWQQYLAQTDVIYVQEYLPIDRDLRIVWVGDRVIDGYWRQQAPGGFYNNVARGGRIQRGLVPREARLLVEQLATTLGIDHGGFDVAMVGSHPYVLEFNRMFGNQGLKDGGKAVDRAIVDYLYALWGKGTPRAPLAPTG